MEMNKEMSVMEKETDAQKFRRYLRAFIRRIDEDINLPKAISAGCVAATLRLLVFDSGLQYRKSYVYLRKSVDLIEKMGWKLLQSSAGCFLKREGVPDFPPANWKGSLQRPVERCYKYMTPNCYIYMYPDHCDACNFKLQCLVQRTCLLMGRSCHTCVALLSHRVAEYL